MTYYGTTVTGAETNPFVDTQLHCFTGGGIPTVTLSDAESQHLSSFLQNIGSPYTDPECFLFRLYLFPWFLPERALWAVHQFRTNPDTFGALLIKRCPIGFVPPTPQDVHPELTKPDFISEGSVCGFSQLTGDIFSLKEEKPALVQNNYARRERASTRSNEGTRLLDLHVELVHLERPFRPDFICLLCLRADPRCEAKTLIVDVRDACRKLSPKILDTLYTPLFVVAPPDSFSSGASWSRSMPILKGDLSMPEVAAEFNSMKGVNPDAQAAFEVFQRACHDPEVLHRVCLEPSDLLLVCNRRSLHGRSDFNASFSGDERWIQRTYMTRDLWPARACATPTWRIFTTL